MQLFLLVSGVLFASFMTPLEASPALESNRPWTHYGVRPLAMGNAFVSVVDDHNALFYNPAGLARLESWDGEFFNPFVSFAKGTRDLMTSFQNLGTESSDVLDLIEENTGQNHFFSAGLTPHLIFPGIGGGAGLELRGSLLFHRYPSAFIDAGMSLIVPISFAFNLLEDRLSIGMGVKYRVRTGIFHEFTIDDLETLTNSDDENGDNPLDEFMEAGYGVGADFGLLFTPMKPMKPTIGLSISDFGGTSFEATKIGDSEPKRPERVLPSVNLGMSFLPIEGKRYYLLAAMDMHSINRPFDFSKKLHFGLEFGVGKILKILTGLHQGYLSGGFQVDAGLLALRMASYASELGETAGQVEDRRYIFELKLLI